MTNRKKLILIIGAVLWGGAFLFTQGFSSFAAEDDVATLKKQITALQKRVEELESAQTKAGIKSEDDSGGFPRRNPNRWDPFDEMARMQQEMDRMFQDSFRWGGPTSRGMFRSNMYYDNDFAIKDEKDKYIIEFDMIGMNQGKIDIQVNDQSLTVRSERAEDKKEEGKNNYFRSQSFATFIRSIPVPPDADTTKMVSERKGDKLLITLPKKVR